LAFSMNYLATFLREIMINSKRFKFKVAHIVTA